MLERLEDIVLKNLVENEEYSKVVSPYVEPKYFNDITLRIISKHYHNFVNKYKSVPKWEELVIDITKNTKLSDKQVDESIEKIEELKTLEHDKFTDQYLVDITEQHFQEVALERVILKGAEILNSEDKQTNKHNLPEMMREALKISFKNTIGQVYGEESQIEKQYEYYHSPEQKYPFPSWSYFNKRLMGGPRKKKMHVFLAGTNVGKSLALVCSAIEQLQAGNNVLYVTAEDDENSIIERIDGNLLDTRTEDLPLIKKSDYLDRLKKVQDRCSGKLVVKEYPTSFANVNHVRALLDELEIKYNFRPDFLIMDYLNLFNSIRFKNMGDSYTMVKAVTEEFRGLAIEKNLSVWSATQLNRTGSMSTDPELTDTSESYGLPMTADLIVAIVENDNLKMEGKYLFKILKSRKYGKVDPRTQKWCMKVDKDKQQIFEPDNVHDGITIEDTEDLKPKEKEFNPSKKFSQSNGTPQWNFK